MNDTMTCTEFEALLPRLLDDDVETPPAARKHLEGCDACRSLLSDLTAIRAEAAKLPALEPTRDLWAGIDERIQAPVVALATGAARGRRELSWRVAGVAAAVLVVATSMVTYRLATQRSATAPNLAALPPVNTAPTDSEPTRVASTQPTPVASEPSKSVAPAARPGTRATPSRVTLASVATGGSAEYDGEISRLRAVLDSGRTRLDPATVAILERNLTVIDSAIAQCRRALLKDPASNFLIESLNSSYQTKVRLLRIAAAASKG